MDALSKLLALSEPEREARGLKHTPAEIFQQPETWRTTYRILSEHQESVRKFLSDAGVGRTTSPSVLLIGAGTSDYVGRSIAALLRRRWRCDVFAVPSTDMLTEMDDYVLPNRPGLWISFSRSGDSSEGVAVLERAIECYPEIRHLVVTCNPTGRMARQFGGLPRVLTLVLDDAVNDRGLAMTSSYTNMVIAGHCLAHNDSLGDYADLVDIIATAGKGLVARAAEFASQLAEEEFDQVCFVGTGTLNAVAMESALKVLEMTAGAVHTRSDSFLGIRHGPLSAVRDNTLFVGFLSNEARRRAFELDLLAEVQQKGLARRRVVIASADDDRARTVSDHLLLTGAGDSLRDEYRPPLDVLFGQLLGLFSSLRQGLQPDNPSPSGAITRVVSEVKIHR